MSASSVAQRLADAGLTLPVAPIPAGDYVPAVRTGALVFTSGQLPVVDGALVTTGSVGSVVSPETAFECARVCALNALAAASTVCDLDSVSRAVKLVGYVASAPGFTAQPSVINGASAVLAAAFGDRGVHAREAVGVAELPLGAPVEVSIILELT
jgi:enamine deaminase RidA (YjgF/YER057c/UK114 family)